MFPRVGGEVPEPVEVHYRGDLGEFDGFDNEFGQAVSPGADLVGPGVVGLGGCGRGGSLGLLRVGQRAGGVVAGVVGVGAVLGREVDGGELGPDLLDRLLFDLDGVLVGGGRLGEIIADGNVEGGAPGVDCQSPSGLGGDTGGAFHLGLVGRCLLFGLLSGLFGAVRVPGLAARCLFGALCGLPACVELVDALVLRGSPDREVLALQLPFSVHESTGPALGLGDALLSLGQRGLVGVPFLRDPVMARLSGADDRGGGAQSTAGVGDDAPVECVGGLDRELEDLDGRSSAVELLEAAGYLVELVRVEGRQAFGEQLVEALVGQPVGDRLLADREQPVDEGLVAILGEAREDRRADGGLVATDVVSPDLAVAFEAFPQCRHGERDAVGVEQRQVAADAAVGREPTLAAAAAAGLEARAAGEVLGPGAGVAAELGPQVADLAVDLLIARHAAPQPAAFVAAGGGKTSRLCVRVEEIREQQFEGHGLAGPVGSVEHEPALLELEGLVLVLPYVEEPGAGRPPPVVGAAELRRRCGIDRAQVGNGHNSFSSLVRAVS
ncbi:MAG: hypothetical protein M5T61_10095 [Acidimicrobiia bacterium]|nr:hypothetical protein [Acidimicrobiia bacterium]